MEYQNEELLRAANGNQLNTERAYKYRLSGCTSNATDLLWARSVFNGPLWPNGAILISIDSEYLRWETQGANVLVTSKHIIIAQYLNQYNSKLPLYRRKGSLLTLFQNFNVGTQHVQALF